MLQHGILGATKRRLLLLLLLASTATPVLADVSDAPDISAAVAASIASNAPSAPSAPNAPSAPSAPNVIVDSRPPSQSTASSGFGTPIAPTGLDAARGGSDLGVRVPLGAIFAAGTVSDNRAINVATGSNTIRDGAFANSNGIPVVIQNTGANVLIQSATIVNVQLH